MKFPKYKKQPLIYALAEPNGGDIRYVGQTINLTKRLHEHYNTRELNSNTYKAHWLKSLRKKNQFADVIIVCDYETQEELNRAEIAWIVNYRIMGCDLVNLNDGGETQRGYKHSEETKRKISEANILYAQSHPFSEEKRAQYVERMTGTKHTEEEKKKMSQGMKGKKHKWNGRKPISEATRLKMSASQKRRFAKENSNF